MVASSDTEQPEEQSEEAEESRDETDDEESEAESESAGDDEAEEAEMSEDEEETESSGDEEEAESSDEDEEEAESSEDEEEEADEEEDEVPGEATILHLNLAGLDLNLLGLEVDLEEVDLDVSAVPGEKRLLGNLLSAVAGLLDESGLLGGLLPSGDGLLGKLPGLPSFGGVTGRIKSFFSFDRLKGLFSFDRLKGLFSFDSDAENGGILRRIGGKLRSFAASLVLKLPVEKVIATVAQTLIDRLLKQLDERAGGLGDDVEEAVADGGIESVRIDESDGVDASAQ